MSTPSSATSGSSATMPDLSVLYPNKGDTLIQIGEKYRELIDTENRLINNRTTWFLTFNGFLFAAYGVIFSNNAAGMYDSILLSFLAFFGIVIAWIFWGEVLLGHIAIVLLVARWKQFLKEYIPCPMISFEIDKDHYFPPIIGLSLDEDEHWAECLELGKNRCKKCGKRHCRSNKKTCLPVTVFLMWVAVFIFSLFLLSDTFCPILKCFPHACSKQNPTDINVPAADSEIVQK